VPISSGKDILQIFKRTCPAIQTVPLAGQGVTRVLQASDAASANCPGVHDYFVGAFPHYGPPVSLDIVSMRNLVRGHSAGGFVDDGVLLTAVVRLSPEYLRTV
jgi:hypothetical protein